VRLETRKFERNRRQSAALYEDREAKIELNLAENLPNAMIDEEQLKRVFVNLIENAVEAFDADQTDKRIVVKTFYDRARDIIVAEIADNGKGISPPICRNFFSRIFRPKDAERVWVWRLSKESFPNIAEK
jgi:two-component system nitrogen regulation sensor histidine kinase NtrY